MAFKINRPPGSAPRLPGFSLLGFSGPDAAAFLQAQSMNDVRDLSDRRWQWNGWLNAKGRLICLFALVKLGEGEFLAVLPDFPAQELLPLLQRYVFRSKVKLRLVSTLVSAAEWTSFDKEAGARNQADGDLESGLLLDWSGDDVQRRLLLLPETDAALGPEDEDCSGRWHDADLAHGLPRLAPSQREAWTPQMLSLDRLQAFSLKKGCYPGQEIVARTHYLGQARRGLSRVTGAGLVLGASLKDEPGSVVGTMVSVAADAASGLAVVQVEKRAHAAWIDGQPVALPPFLEGLQR